LIILLQQASTPRFPFPPQTQPPVGRTSRFKTASTPILKILSPRGPKEKKERKEEKKK